MSESSCFNLSEPLIIELIVQYKEAYHRAFSGGTYVDRIRSTAQLQLISDLYKTAKQS